MRALRQWRINFRLTEIRHYNLCMKFTFDQILIIVVVALTATLLYRWMRSKFSLPEKYLLRCIQRKSPQLDNVRLFMLTKTVVRHIHAPEDLDYQTRFLEDSIQFKDLCEQYKLFGARALYPLLGYESIHWELNTTRQNPLVTRLAASQVCRCFPRTAGIIEDLLARSPDSFTTEFVVRNRIESPTLRQMHSHYHANLLYILRLLVETPANEWWPGTHPDVRAWAEETLGKYEVKKN